MIKKLVPVWIRKETYPMREYITRSFNNFVSEIKISMLSKKNIYHTNIIKCEQRFYSQNGEDGIINVLFSIIGTTNKYFVEFGVEDGKVCNTRRLIEKGWNGLQMEASEVACGDIKREHITAENVLSIFEKYAVPFSFDFLSVDIDGNDYWVLKRILEVYHPRAICVEYNALLGRHESLAIEYDPDFVWDGTDYFGASLSAFYYLADVFGYKLICCDNSGVNCFFIANDSIRNTGLEPMLPHLAYRPLAKKHKQYFHNETKKWVNVL